MQIQYNVFLFIQESENKEFLQNFVSIVISPEQILGLISNIRVESEINPP